MARKSQAAAHTAATCYALPQPAQGLLRAIDADAGFLLLFGQGADRLANVEDCE